METKLWSDVDEYTTGRLSTQTPVLDAALSASDAAGLPTISVSPSQGMLLSLLARLVHAKRILEIGTLGGYSTIWLARALEKDGRLISLEYSEKHAEVARGNIARAGLSEVAEVRVGDAGQTIQKLS